MSGPGLHYFDEVEERLVLEAVRARKMTRYRFDGDMEQSNTYLFERKLESFLGAPHCLGVNSCTSALFLALRGLGIAPGDEVLVPGYTFIATLAAIIHAGAIPVLCEIDASLTMNPEDARARITPRTKAILPVHMLGAPCRMDALEQVARENDLFLIEDTAQAMGGTFRDSRLGAIGDAGAFSLNVFKTMTAGDGGVLTTRRESLYQSAFAIHDHGFAPMRSGVKPDSEHFGLNMRMHELAGSVALAQLEKLPRILEDQRRRKRLFLESIGGVPGATRRILNDPDGECATLIVYIFDTPQRAARVAGSLGSRTLIDSGMHYYGNMSQLTQPGAWPRAGDVPSNLEQRYGRGCLPRTDDILARSVALSVGVNDSHLGAGFGISPDLPEEAIGERAIQFAKRLKSSDQ